ncbi:MAG: 4-hydroxybenzoate polyprenyltransferase [Gammaproteobacteria bacterium]
MKSMTSGKSLAWAKLLRLSLFPSALADPLAGAAVAGALWKVELPGLLVAVAASLAVFHGSMAINDWHDLAEDKVAGRERPLTAGHISPTAALGAGILMVLIGALLAAWTGFRLMESPWAAFEFFGVAALAVGYNIGLRGPLLGPGLLGLCRAGNFLFGALLVLGSAGLSSVGLTTLGSPLQLAVLASLFYFTLVFQVSLLGRYEDGEAEAEGLDLARIVKVLLRRQALLLLGMPLVLGAIVLAAGHGGAWTWATVALSVALGFYFAAPQWRASGKSEWTRAGVESIMGLCLSRFVPFGILAVLVTSSSWHGLLLAGVLFGLAKLGRRLMAVIPPS